MTPPKGVGIVTYTSSRSFFPAGTMATLRRVISRLQVLSELTVFLRERKLWWLLPLVLVLVVMAVLLLLAQSSAVAPLIYPLI